MTSVLKRSHAVAAFFVLAATAFSFTAAAADKSAVFVPADGSVKFLAIGKPQALRIKGEGEGPRGKVRLYNANGAKVSGEFHFSLNSLNTGIGMRDTHMKEKYLQTEKFPDADLTINDVAVDAGILTGASKMGDSPFKGKLKLHGVEKDINGHFTASRDDAGKIKVHVEFTVKISDFGIDIPKYLGITVAEDVSVEVETAGVVK